LAVIAAACRDNTQRISTLQLSGTAVLTGRRFAGMRDPFNGQTYDSQNRSFSVWRDASGNARLDVTADRETDGRTPEVQYNLPYGEHIMSCRKLQREGGWGAVERENGTPQSTARIIVNSSESYRYEPERNQLYLNQPGSRPLDEELEMQLALNRVPDAGTGAELLERWAAMADQPGRSVTLMELGGGQYHVRLTIDTLEAEGRASSYTRDVVVDLERGGNIVSYAAQTDGNLVEKGQFDFMNVGGAWVVAHAEVDGGIGPDGVPMVKAVYEVQPESIQINRTVDPQVFSLASLDVRRGALVHDSNTDEPYLYDDVPLEIKIALALEREREEEAAASAEQQDAQEGAAEQPMPQVARPKADNSRSPAPEAAKTAKDASSSYVLLTSEPPRVREPSTRPTATARVIVEPAKAAEPTTPDEGIPARSPPAVTTLVPGTAATVVAVSVGCGAALAVGIWRWTRPRS
jgi:hypothetical protein